MSARRTYPVAPAPEEEIPPPSILDALLLSSFYKHINRTGSIAS